jgi:hypothetical protein
MLMRTGKASIHKHAAEPPWNGRLILKISAERGISLARHLVMARMGIAGDSKARRSD